MLKKTYRLNQQEMKQFVAKLSPVLEKGFILLEGSLGAGKTSFVQELLACKGLEEVTSPTYSLVHRYEARDRLIFHADLYRIEYATQLRDLELEFYQDELFFIEWGLKFADFLQPIVAQFTLEHCPENSEKRLYHAEFFDPFGTGYLNNISL